MIKLFLLGTLIFGQNFIPKYDDVCRTYFTEIKVIAENMGWRVTATTNGKHNTGSKHYQGKAVDLSVRGKTQFDVDMLTLIMENEGYVVLDERKKPKNRVWSAPHMHISVPQCK